jgi:prepilin signal peptidase PulO-like enzyme (type II secretory pathway)
MYVFWAVFAFLLGTVIGSFLNVVILRHNTGRSLSGRSGCGVCGKTLTWRELIPVLSFLVQRGRCRTCRSPLSLQYPIVETLAGLAFFSAYLVGSNGVHAAFLALVLSLLIVIAVYDVRHRIVPNRFVYTLSALAALALFIEWSSLSLTLPAWQEVLAGPLLFLPFFALWFYSGGTWMGLGDGKVALAIGWLLGLRAGFSALVLSFWLGAALALMLLLVQWLAARGYIRGQLRLFGIQQPITMKTELAFAPLLVAGFTGVLLFGIDVLELFAYY